MKDINISVDDETYRLFEIHAARSGKPVSEFARGILVSFVQRNDNGSETSSQPRRFDLDRRRKQLRELFADFDSRGVGVSTDDILPRDALYQRGGAGRR